MLASLALTLALFQAAPAADTARGAIRGIVQSEPSGLPVPSAIVEVETGDRTWQTLADSAGHYVLRLLPPGRRTFRVRHLEHAPMQMEVLIPAGGEVVLDVFLRHRPLALPGVTGSGTPMAGGDTVAVRRGDLALMDMRALEEGSGLAGSGFGSAGADPGGAPPDADDVFYVRGSAADLKLVLLDGAPVYAPFHMGGLMEAFEPAVLGSARMYLGGAPAKFDGGLSYVMDLATRGGNRERHTASGSVDLVSVRAVAEGPITSDGSTFLVSARRVHGATLGRLEGDPFPYQYGDGLARVDVPMGGRLSLRATGFMNGEGVRVDTAAGELAFARWQNRAGSLRIRGPMLGAEGEATLAVGYFDARLPQRVRSHELVAWGSTRRSRLALDLVSSHGPVRLRYGGSYDHVRVYHQVRERETFYDRDLLAVRSVGAATAAYGDASWQAAPRLLLRGGVRADLYSEGLLLSFSPRASATWLVGEKAALTLAGGRYHQYVRARPEGLVLNPQSPFADSLRSHLSSDLRVASATHVSLSLDQEMSEGVRLGLEGFYKRYEGLPASDGVGAYTSGVDVWARRGTGDFTGWLGYTLAWVWSLPDQAATSEKFTGRQVLSAGLAGPVGRLARFGVRFQYGSGLPFSGIGLDAGGVSSPPDGEGGLGNSSGGPGAEEPLAGPDPAPYMRLDAEVSRTMSPRMWGRRTEITPYFRLINALDRRDALFYRYEEESSVRSVAALPLLPVFGLDWKF